jgi:hypothetical protein
MPTPKQQELANGECMLMPRHAGQDMLTAVQD